MVGSRLGNSLECHSAHKRIVVHIRISVVSNVAGEVPWRSSVVASLSISDEEIGTQRQSHVLYILLCILGRSTGTGIEFVARRHTQIEDWKFDLCIIAITHRASGRLALRCCFCMSSTSESSFFRTNSPTEKGVSLLIRGQWARMPTTTCWTMVKVRPRAGVVDHWVSQCRTVPLRLVQQESFTHLLLLF